ncbi:MAG: cytochrome c1 [Gammaproteobacteria bacterium]|jgi:ubiquinol-cytochrome c reductase cytochrome c1 subunit|nr:cytochrome c1 [Gammaproteobacteria bacterium]
MNKQLIAVLLAIVPVWVFAAGGHGVSLDKANIDPTNVQSLQRGAGLFVNYCLSCHSANLMRYEHMGNDLGIDEKMVSENLIFTGGKVGDLMTVASAPADSMVWFGTVPPDLTVIARARGVDWLYTYLRSFYRDDSRHIGTNNLVFPDVGMPNVLWELQGVQEPVITTIKGHDGTEVKEVGLELVEPGTLTPTEFDRAVRDLVNFLDYMGEPAKHERRALGTKVVLFLLMFLVLAYLLKREFWKDIH